jgi:hypothetical protein
VIHFRTERATLPSSGRSIWLVLNNETLEPVPEARDFALYLNGAGKSDNTIRTYITQSRPARHGRAFIAALGPDKCDLGRHPNFDLAVSAVVADARAGWPRSPRNSKERYRELYDAPAAPLFPLSADY